MVRVRKINRSSIGWQHIVVSVAAVALTVNALRRVWFYYDDFWNIAEARLSGFGWTHLTHSVLGHFYPGYNLSFWTIHAAGSQGYALGVAFTALGMGVIGVLVAAIAAQLGASRSASLAAVAATLLFGAWPAVNLWLSASTNSVPAAIFMLAALLFHLKWFVARADRTSHDDLRASGGHRRQLGLACASGLMFGCGLAFYESAIFMFAVIFGVTVLAFTSGGLADRTRQLTNAWPIWLAYVPPIAALGIAFAVGPYGEEFTSQGGAAVPHPDALQLIRVAGKAVIDGLGTSAIGLHPGRFDVGGSATLSAAAAAVVFLLGATWLYRRVGVTALFAIVVMVVPFAVRMALAAWGRLTMLGWDIAHDVRYFADYAWVIPIVTLAALTQGPIRPRLRSHVGAQTHATSLSQSATGRFLGRTMRATPVVIAVIALLAIWRFEVVIDTSPQIITERYRARFERSYNALTADGNTISLLDTLVPADVLGPQFGGFTHLSHTLIAGYEDLPYNEPYAPMYAPDFEGDLQPVELIPIANLRPEQAFTSEEPVTTTTGLEGESCWTAGAKTARVWVPLDASVEPGFGVIRLKLGAETTVEDPPVLAAGLLPISLIGSAVDHDWQRDRVVITSHYFAATQLGFDIAGGSTLCLASGTVDRLAPPVQ